MKNPNLHLDQEQLNDVMFGDEESESFRQSSLHLENCSTCRERLTAASDSTLDVQEVRALLEDYDLESKVIGDPDSDVVDFLDAPSHPEMLGRLGRYEIERVIGRGGMGVVLKGFDSELNRPVAIKVLASHLANNRIARDRFAREARAAAAVVNEHVVAIHNVETDGKFPYLVMQYVPGESLQSRVERQGALDAKELLRIAIHAAMGLSAAHEQGVVHRDVKPANIILEEGVERAMLTDFGLARTVDDASLTHTGVVAGTPSYMSPEQANGVPTDFHTDLFSLGAVIYFMATGRPPFRAERALGVLHRICHHTHRPVWDVNPEIPDDLSAIIDKLLEKKPKNRFADAEEARKSLLTSLARLQQHGRPKRSQTKRFFARYRWQVFASVVSIVILATAVVLLKTIPVSRATTTSQSQEPPASFEQISVPTDDEFFESWHEVKSGVQQLEAELSDSRFIHAVDAEFDKNVQRLNVRIEELSSEFFTSKLSQPNEE